MDDLGEFLPGAVKHDIKQSKSISESTLSKAELWPEPDWEQLLANPKFNPVSLAICFCLYRQIRNKPRASHLPMTQNQADQEYVRMLNVKKQVCRAILQRQITSSKVDDLYTIFYEFTSISREDIKKGFRNDPNVRYIFATCRGEVRYHYPWALHGRSPLIVGFVRVSQRRMELAEIAKLKEFPYEAEPGNWYLANIKGSSFEWLVDSKGSFSSVWNLCKERMKERLASEVKYNPERDMEKVLAPTKVLGRALDMSGEKLMSTFNLRAVQFGNSLSEKEKQYWIDNVFISLWHLSVILGVKSNPQKIGLGGIAFAFGARGRGKASAHFESHLRAINLTRKKGPGAIAHEWAHALDYCFGGILVNPRNQTPSSEAFYIEEERSRTPHSKDAHRAMKELMLLIGDRQRDYYKSAVRIQSGSSRRSGYWSSPVEMFARAFEAYIEDQLIGSKQRSDWLVCGTQYHDIPEKHRDTRHPYPQGEQRRQINLAMHQFITAVMQITPEGN